MTVNQRPSTKPSNPNFSSGPCSKRPGYDVANLDIATLGRSHRSSVGKIALGKACTDTAEILGLPEGYRVGVVPASDTGAVEMIMWSVLGQRPVDIFAWESFGSGWLTDATKQLKLEELNSYTADYGLLPDMSQANPDHDCIFTWNGTTAGVKVPNADWISDDRTGLTICDATSAVFAMEMPQSGRAIRNLYASMADAQNLPHDQRGQINRRNFPRRDHQHALYAMCCGLFGCAKLDSFNRWTVRRYR